MLNDFKDEDFDSKIKNEDISVIQFSAAWCGPVKLLFVMTKLSDEYKDKAGFYYATSKMVELILEVLQELEVYRQLLSTKKVLK